MDKLQEVIQNILQSTKNIRQIDIPLSRESQKLFGDILEIKRVKKNSLLCHEGQICPYIFYISKGLIRQFYYKKNKDVTEHFACEREMFICIESYLLQKPSYLQVEALEDTELYCIPYSKIEKLVKTDFEINNLYRAMIEASLILSQQKADSIRYESAHERYENMAKSQPEIIKRAPLQHIASFLLMTPESLSRIRSGIL